MIPESIPPRPTARNAPDRPDGRAYVVRGDLDLAVDVARATGRPLLLRGDPGSGKSSFAAHVAWINGWAYHEHVVTSRTQAPDLLWSFDHVLRLADAQAQRLKPIDAYVEPGVLWKAFAPHSASAHALRARAHRLPRPRGRRPVGTDGADLCTESVVLIDEIDKADPELPNGLLVPLGSRRFTVSQTGRDIEPEDDARALVVITTNEQRELPEAFLRRCLVVKLEHPEPAELVEVARTHVEAYGGSFTDADLLLARELAEVVQRLREDAERRAHRRPSTAEFLDAFHVCRDMEIRVEESDERWRTLRRMALLKQDNVA
ncbi:AAA family ATPase [Streptomyces chartreusis]|uniref:AAA family ATPase n=1 Tax=Streptomyces chartreusis TaxID=1969 RepID=UPI0038131194|nr:MoxR family ATPase [Streptomyces chartreusis]